MKKFLKVEVGGKTYEVVPTDVMGHLLALHHFKIPSRDWNEVNSFAAGEHRDVDLDIGVEIHYILWESVKVSDAVECKAAGIEVPDYKKFRFAVISFFK